MKIDTNPKKINDLINRGVEQIIERRSLVKKLKSGKKLRIKHGIDPTGPKIHLGRAAQFWKLRAFQELGHQVVLIFGDFTAQIGDASDKTSMRKPLTEKEVKENMKGYKKQIGKILDIDKTEFHNNSEWLSKLNLKKIIRLSMEFTAQQMIQRRNFKQRWDKAKPIGIHELIYPILQGYDSYAIKSDVEIGGTDQLFNLKVGRKIQEMFSQKPQDIMTLEMLPGLNSEKMSTSIGNVINISDKPSEIYGKIMSMKDDLIEIYFRLCTKIPLKEINQIAKEIKSEKLNPKEAKMQLAREVVKMYYGENEAKKADKEFNSIFKDKKIPSRMPVFETIKNHFKIIDLIFETGLAKSKSEAKRLIEQGGVKVISGNKQDKILNWKQEIKINNQIVLKVGKTSFLKIKTKQGKK